jgi:hypothetical protein
LIGEKGKELNAFETEDTKSLAANRPDVCAGERCHTLNSGFAL